MLFLEFLQYVQLLLFVAGRLAHLLLALVEHHLLDHATGLAVQVAEVAVLGLDLGGVDFGRGGDDVGPPLHLVDLVEMQADFLAAGDGLEGPGGVVDVDGVGEVALDDGGLALDGDAQACPGEVDIQVAAFVLCVYGHGDVHVLDGLRPSIGQGGLLGVLARLCIGIVGGVRHGWLGDWLGG